MRKIIILIMVIGFVGSASAAEVTYHFTARIDGYSDNAGIFSQLGYTDNMPIEGTITYDTEAASLYTYEAADGSMGIGWYKEGLIKFGNQIYEWTSGCEKDWVIKSYPAADPDGSPYHTTEILIEQDGLENIEGVTLVSQKVILKNDGWNVVIPAELSLGSSGVFNMAMVSDQGESSMSAVITEIMSEADYNASLVQTTSVDEPEITAAKAKKHQFTSRKNARLYKRIEKANAKLQDDNLHNDKGALKELKAYMRQYKKRLAKGAITSEEDTDSFIPLITEAKANSEQAQEGAKKAKKAKK